MALPIYGDGQIGAIASLDVTRPAGSRWVILYHRFRLGRLPSRARPHQVVRRLTFETLVWIALPVSGVSWGLRSTQPPVVMFFGRGGFRHTNPTRRR